MHLIEYARQAFPLPLPLCLPPCLPVSDKSMSHDAASEDRDGMEQNRRARGKRRVFTQVRIKGVSIVFSGSRQGSNEEIFLVYPGDRS